MTSLRPGTKVALIVAASLLAIAAYFFMTPTNFPGKDGGLFGCGSPMSPNESDLAKGQCGILEKVALNRALLFLALSIITALLGFLLFGSDNATQGRSRRPRLEDSRDDDDHDEHEDRGSRSGLLAGRAERAERRPRLGDEDSDDSREDETPAHRRPRLSGQDTRGTRDEEGSVRRRPRLGDEDAEPEARPVKTRTRLSDDDARDPRPKRRGGRYDDDAFDTVRD